MAPFSLSGVIFKSSKAKRSQTDQLTPFLRQNLPCNCQAKKLESARIEEGGWARDAYTVLCYYQSSNFWHAVSP